MSLSGFFQLDLLELLFSSTLQVLLSWVGLGLWYLQKCFCLLV
jgi:hypothetical protein